MPAAPAPRWLLLIHQIPPRPAYLRVKIGRRLQGLGAVAVKNSVYVLPRGAEAREDFQWIRSEIVAGGGDATICEARFLDGLSDAAVEALFNAERAADYAALAREAQALRAEARRSPGRRRDDRLIGAVVRLRKRLADLAAIDFFGAPGRAAVERLLESLRGKR